MRLVEDENLRKEVLKRLSEMQWRDADLIRDAEERGCKISASCWTKYKKNKSGQITDDVLFWICVRIGINVVLRFGEPVISGNKITWVIPKYDEIEALKRLKLIYGKNG